MTDELLVSYAALLCACLFVLCALVFPLIAIPIVLLMWIMTLDICKFSKSADCSL